ncbi:putative Transposable element Hobo transposase [Hypsibius exemplaris]|uniref:Transposable element Hobo transposase n=1 Tax=Hypsibius exemplaris TaxID=2072580 RepID=A0A9X6NNE3_HYPEX|nr:putative Transposable element Hobo transposase [Hypsibius exemplaris]
MSLLAIEIPSDSDDDESSSSTTTSTLGCAAMKRKMSVVLRSGLSTDSVVQGIRGGEFVMRDKANGRADYWQTFAEVVDSADGTNMEYIACKKCRAPFKHTRKSGTTNLIEHTKSCTGNKGQQKIVGFITLTVSADSKKAISRACALMFAKDSRAFSIVEGSGFKAFVDVILLEAAKSKTLLTVSDLLCEPRTVSRNVTTEANRLRVEVGEKVRAAIKSFGGGMTTDMWTEDYNKTAFMSLTYHYRQSITQKKQLLYCAEYEVSKKKGGSEIHEFLFNRLLPFDITESQCGDVIFVTDGAGTMVKAFNPLHKGNRGKPEIERVTCACHLINTALTHQYRTDQLFQHQEQVRI